MPTALRDRDVVTESWLATDALRLAQVRALETALEESSSDLPADLYADLLSDPTPTPAKVYPKRSELRRAEARSGRRGGERRPGSGHGPAPSAPIVQGRRGTQPAGPGSARRGVRRDEPTRQIMTVRDDQVAPGQLPIAFAPTAAVLPIPHLDDETRPAGLNLSLDRRPDAFGRTPALPTVPIAVPMPARSPERRQDRGQDRGQEWGQIDRAREYDLDDAPTQIGLGSDGVPLPSRPPAGLQVGQAPQQPQVQRAMRSTRPARGRAGTDRRKIGAARMLVLAMVVSAEGVALTQMAGHPTLDRPDASTLTGSLSAAAVLADSADRQASAETAQQEAVTMADAQTESGAGKVAAALAQAKSAADRVKAAAARRDQVLRNAQRDPRSVARILAGERGWGASQFSCLDSLWNRESQWNYRASNPSSGAYGIPQSLPGSKMASAGSDWRTNPVTQIKWGLNYIADRYGSPCGAWGHSESVGWY